jgi:anti-anti-sigma factor
LTVDAETVTVTLSGEFDATSEGFLADCLALVYRERPRRLIFETAEVTYLDCASARLIVGTHRWLPHGVRPVIVRPVPIVRRLLQVSGLSERCELEPP